MINPFSWYHPTTGPDTTPPSSDPPTWNVSPVAISDTEVTMTVNVCTDPSGVEYFFFCSQGGGADSSWQDGLTFIASGLTPDSGYSWQVRARDKSPAQNITAYSVGGDAQTDA